MELFTFDNMGPFGVNCYAVVSEKKNAVLIDAPCNADGIISMMNENGFTLKKVLLTHGHCDHIGAAAELREKTGCEIYIHRNDAEKLTNQNSNLTTYFHLPPVDEVKDAVILSHGDTVTLDELTFKVMLTAGHTSGSVCYIIDDIIFSGDTLFRLSVGRTDMRDGSFSTLKASLEAIAALDEKPDYVVFPGHGDPTRLSYEKENNAFMQENGGYDYML